jgi:hypothetical protein
VSFLTTEPLLELKPEGGQVVVTRFDCRRLWPLLIILALHHRVKQDVQRDASGFLGVTTCIDWRGRSLLSISLWKSATDLYSMGKVTRHIFAARLPQRLKVTTTSGVYCYAGDWRRVMFHSDYQSRSPLQAMTSPSVSETSAAPQNGPISTTGRT